MVYASQGPSSGPASAGHRAGPGGRPAPLAAKVCHHARAVRRTGQAQGRVAGPVARGLTARCGSHHELPKSCPGRPSARPTAARSRLRAIAGGCVSKLQPGAGRERALLALLRPALPLWPDDRQRLHPPLLAVRFRVSAGGVTCASSASSCGKLSGQVPGSLNSLSAVGCLGVSASPPSVPSPGQQASPAVWTCPAAAAAATSSRRSAERRAPAAPGTSALTAPAAAPG
jgi:hypothetical protein